MRYDGPPADLETRKRVSREIEPLRRQQSKARDTIEHQLSVLQQTVGQLPTAGQVSASIAAAVSGLDTVAARTQAITAALVGLDTVSARNTAIASAISGLDTISARAAAITAATSGLATQSALAALAAMIPTVPASKFLDGTFTVATLPAAATNSQKYAWVTDLFDNQPDLVLSDGAKWKPVRPLATRTVANANAAMTLTPLINSPTQILKGTLTANRNLTLSTQYAYSGARFRVKREAGGLFAVVVGLASALNLNLSSWADFEFDGTAWVQTASGGLL